MGRPSDSAIFRSTVRISGVTWKENFSRAIVNMNITVNSLDIIFDEFKEKIVHINCCQGFTKSISKTALKDLKDQYEREKAYGLEIQSSDTMVMFCEDILSGVKVSIGSKEFSIDEYFSIHAKIRNKQYQWLLVEAYEVFESYLKKLYANIGYFDNDFWEQKDFGRISISEIKNCDLNWFIQQMKENKKTPDSILRQIHKKIPVLNIILAHKKKNNPKEIDYRFMVNLISKLRHIIVHNNGITDKSEFIKNRLKEIGRNSYGGKNQKYIDIVSWYFGIEQLSNTVCLTEARHPTGKLMYYDRLNDLVEVIASYAMFIHNITKKHLESKINNKVN